MYIYPCEKMKLPSCPRTLIINILRNNPDGLTLTSIAKLTGLHRHTATKYIYELKGAGIINERDVGSAKLCYLKEGFSKEDEKRIVRRLNGNRLKSSTGQVQILTLFLFLFLIPTSVIIAQNVTQSFNLTGNITGLILEDNGTGNITAENISGVNITAIMNESIIEDAQGGLTSTGNTTSNETVTSEGNASEIQIDANITIPEANATAIEPGYPVLEVRIASPDSIARGETFDISAVVENSGNSEAKNVRIFWEIPSGFGIVSGESQASCGTMQADSECMSSLTLSSTISTDIGKSEFKVKVKYEK